MTQIKQRVEVELARRGWTKSELARAMGISPQGLYDTLVRGSQTVTTLTKIAKALGITIAELVTPVTPVEYGEAMIDRK